LSGKGREFAAGFRLIRRPLNHAGKKLIVFGDCADTINSGFNQRRLYGEISMVIKKGTFLAPPSERRRFGRIKIAEPRICHVHLPQSQELWTGQGTLVNISLGGIYLVCQQQPPIDKNDICYLTFDTPDSETENSYFKFHVSVVRAGETQLDQSQFGLGLKILSDPVYFSAYEDNGRELTLLDKTQIMYKFYDLNKKAYDIIVNTPDIRTDKINNIREFIEKGSYKVNSKLFTQRVINDIFLENIGRFTK